MLYTVGLFLHMGYSLTERYLLEIHSSVRFRVDRMRSKLTLLLNGDSAEQVRALSPVLTCIYYFLICISSVLEELQVEKEPWENQSIKNGMLWPYDKNARQPRKQVTQGCSEGKRSRGQGRGNDFYRAMH